MTDRNGDTPSPYLELDRDAWRALRASTPMALTAAELDEIRGVADPIQLSDVEDVYLPLSRLLRLHYEASAGLREAVGTFLTETIRPAPFMIAVAGSVAVGKSTASRVLRTLISRWPQRPQTELVTTDNFLFPNAVLQERGLMERKGFPESYDRRALLRFVQQVRAGASLVTAPVYSHLAYDIVPGEVQSVRQPDARADHILRWFLRRLHALRETAFTDPRSPFRMLAEVSTAELDEFGSGVWQRINEVNLVENIQPTRARASLVLHKGADHAVTRVRLRRFLAGCRRIFFSLVGTMIQDPDGRAIHGGKSMATLVKMQDGTEIALHEHLRDDHHKGTRGYTEAFLGRMHAQLHDHKHSSEHAHTEAEPAALDQLIPQQRTAD